MKDIWTALTLVAVMAICLFMFEFYVPSGRLIGGPGAMTLEEVHLGVGVKIYEAQ